MSAITLGYTCHQQSINFCSTICQYSATSHCCLCHENRKV